MASRLQAGERARCKKDFWDYVWQGAATEDLTCNGLEWQMGNGGGRIIEDDQTTSINNPQTIQARQRRCMLGWVYFAARRLGSSQVAEAARMACLRKDDLSLSIVEPSFAIRMKISPGCPFGQRPTVR
jgi:hypothetical protein